MAREITLTVAVDASKGGVAAAASRTVIRDMAGEDMFHGVQTIATSPTALNLGEVTKPAGLVFVYNLDATNYATLIKNGEAFAKLSPGGFPAVFQMADATAINALANTAAVELEVFVLEA